MGLYNGPPARTEFRLPLIVVDTTIDYVRNNAIDALYSDRFKLRLIALYGNRCALCATDSDNVHMDHLFVPKKQGGNFALRTVDGTWFNNAAPLCRVCNLKKSAKDYRWFVTPEILAKNTKATEWLADGWLEVPGVATAAEVPEALRVEPGRKLTSEERAVAFRRHVRAALDALPGIPYPGIFTKDICKLIPGILDGHPPHDKLVREELVHSPRYAGHFLGQGYGGETCNWWFSPTVLERLSLRNKFGTSTKWARDY